MLGNGWDEVLSVEYTKDYFLKLKEFVLQEYKVKTIYPKINEVFNAFFYTSFNDVKVVILGQDPYHGINQAEGLSFSVKKGVKKPPSLVNIFKELQDDLGCWGSYARSKKNLITNNKHLIIESSHPSPLSAYNGFFGSRPFSRTNKFLKDNGLKEIDWQIH